MIGPVDPEEDEVVAVGAPRVAQQPSDSAQQSRPKKEKTLLRKLDDYLTPAPRFDPEDPAQINGLKRLKRHQLKVAFLQQQKEMEKNGGAGASANLNFDEGKKKNANPISELIPDKCLNERDL